MVSYIAHVFRLPTDNSAVGLVLHARCLVKGILQVITNFPLQPVHSAGG